MQAAFPLENRQVAAPLFASLKGPGGIIAAGLAGRGRLLVDNPLHPRCAVMTVGDFLVCGGEPGLSARHLLRVAMSSEKREWVACGSEAWLELVADFGPVCRHLRWAFAPEQPKDEHLRSLMASSALTFAPLAGTWPTWCRKREWARDFVSCYADDADYARHGLGVLALLQGEPVAGASAYVPYPGGLEVQVQTREDCQGRGYATETAATMIQLAHQAGLAVTWDAANEASARVAEKLGYRSLGAYPAALVPLR